MHTNRNSLSTHTTGRARQRWCVTAALLLVTVGCSGDDPSDGGPGSTTNSGDGITSNTGSSIGSTTAAASTTGLPTTQTSGGTLTGVGPSSSGTLTSGTSSSAGGASGVLGGTVTSSSSGGVGPGPGGTETSSVGGATTDGTNTVGTTTGGGTGGTGMTCPLPATFKWTSSGPLAEPKNPGAKSLKDFSVTTYNGNYLVYGTTADGEWNGFVSTFSSFDQWKNAEQRYIRGLVAPTIFYFTPKDTWVLAYQWGFKYSTSKTPDDPSSWTPTQSLLVGDPTNNRGTGPIDQTIICDDSDCYIFFNDDAGGVYRGSMPISQFPGAFSNVTRIMDEQPSVIFEGVQVYSIKGSSKYLMIIENNGTRFFRAWTADSLDGEWTPLDGAFSEQQPFAGRNNVTWPDGKWTDDISHGDLVRENPSEKMEIDPCNLQMIYQGRDPNQNPSYIDRPYRPGLLTLVR